MATAAVAPDKRQLEAQQAELEAHRTQVAAARDSLRQAKDVPFVWDIAFVEVFSGERQGFDLLLGNPPYVRHESIRNPLLALDEGLDQAADKAAVAAYKTALADAAYARWPKTFGYGRGKQTLKLDGRSDLYIYFYLVALSLLNPQGAFCFVTSNAWLDVAYGAELQRFLLTRGLVRLVLDNQVRRSFKDADVNTVIALLGPAVDDRRDRAASLDHLARFVMFTVPYEQGLSAVLWQEVCEARARRAMPEYRVHPLTQRDALAAGSDQANVYAGDKWGGKYLRAPDIYWEILRRAGDRLVRLGDVADVRFGIKTGANEFFQIDAQQADSWGIEAEFLVPFLFSLKEVQGYQVRPDGLKRRLLVCRESKAELRLQRKDGVLRYIESGEESGYSMRPSVRGRRQWYSLPDQESADFVSNRFLGERVGFPVIDGIAVCDVFFIGSFRGVDGILGTALLNSSICLMVAEVVARKTYGTGVAYMYGPEIRGLLMPSPCIVTSVGTALHEAFGAMRRRRILPLEQELAQSDRQALDEVVLAALGLQGNYRALIYESLLEMMRARLAKASSLEGM